MKKNSTLSFLKERSTYILFGAIGLLLIIVISLVSFGDGEDKPGHGLTVTWKSGEVLFSGNGEIWEFADPGTLLEEGFMIKTGGDAKVALKTPQGGFVRLSENTEVKITQAGKRDLLLTQLSGRSFHRVKKHKTDVYQVSVFGNTVKAIGTAFDIATNTKARRINVKVLFGKVEVSVDHKDVENDLEVIKGKEVTVDPNSDPVFRFADINKGYIESEWFKWNRLEEKQAGYSLRIADEIGGREDVGNPAFDGSGGTQETTEANEATAPKSTSTSTAANTTTTTTTTAPKTTTTASGTCRPYLTAKKSHTYGGILLNWTACKPVPTGFQFYKVVRSSGNSNPSYPNDPVISSSSNTSYSSYIDKKVAPNRTYYYRICVAMRLNKVTCGNTVSAMY